MLNASRFGYVWSRSQKLDVATGLGIPVLSQAPLEPLVGREMCLFFDIILEEKRDSIKNL